MIVRLSTRRMTTLDQVRACLDGNEPVDYHPLDRGDAYAFVRDTLVTFGYQRLGRPDKGTIRRYLAKFSGLSLPQVERLIRRHRDTGRVVDLRAGNSGRDFPRVYQPADIRLLAEIDEAYRQMSGAATAEVLRRQHQVFGDARFARLAGISPSHIYNLRKSRSYRLRRTTFDKTRPAAVAVGVRKAPEPEGRPGFLRVDTVHQGDRDGVKGIYLINLIDQTTQFELVAAVEAISERFLLPVLTGLLEQMPFRIRGFHADNGSEYVNHRVADLLAKLHVEFTRSRPRRSNDNALVEGKNAHVVRKYFGHDHIPQCFAARVDAFARQRLSPFLNYHRPCLFPVERRDARGKIKRTYPRGRIATPYEALKRIPGAEDCLKPGITFEQLDWIAYAQSDLAAATELNTEQRELFRIVFDTPGAA